MFNRSKRSIGGSIARIQGNRFENIINSVAASERISCIKIPEGCKIVRARGRLIPLPIRSPFDFILAFQGQVAFVDAKIVKTATFSHSKMTSHQLYNLDSMRNQGLIAGYLICFERETDAKVAFFDVKLLESVRKGQSLRPKDGLEIGNLYQFSLRKLFVP